MIDALAKLMQHYPVVANIPLIAILLLVCALLFYTGFRHTAYFWPGRVGTILLMCYKTGSALLIVFCLLGIIHFAMQTSLDRHHISLNPVLLGLLVLAYLLVLVPCILRDENRRRERRRVIAPLDPPRPFQ